MNEFCKATLLALILLPGAASASELVYVPVNPNFGGNPLNGAMLLGNAQAQDSNKDPSSSAPLGGPQVLTPLQQFNQALQSAILNRIASSVTGSLVGANGQLLPGTVDTQNFTIAIIDLGNGMLRVTTTDKSSGATTSFDVSSKP